MAETRTGKFPSVIFLIVAAALLLAPAGSPAAVSEAAGECLGCHDDEGMEMDIAGGEVLSLNIPSGAYGGSVHGDLDCTDCHSGVSLDSHPEGTEIAALEEYRRRSSEACGECHDLDGLGAGMHRRLVATKDAPACSECHDPHAVRPVVEWKAELDTSEYCLTCHRRSLTLTLGNGEGMSLTVDRSMLEGSVHLSHSCPDCHAEFGTGEHPVREFTSAREHTVALAAACRQCHDDKFEQYEGSIHYRLLQTGNLAVPVCTDCHGFHTVKEAETIARLAGTPCRQCHGEVFEAFGSSRHGRAEKGGHIEAPVCANCHRAHEVRPAFWADEMKRSCVACHPRAQAAHREWLPNADLHLDAVACPACHAPRAERAIELVLGEASSGRPLTEEKLRSLLDEGGGRALLERSGGSLDAAEIWNLLRRVNKGNGSQVALFGRMRIRSGLDAHRMEGRQEALRDCDSCHRPGASPFESVTVTILRDDGRPLRYEAEGAVLGSVTSVDSLRGFYMLGGTRIRLLDFLLIAAVLGGMSVPALHLTARAVAKRRG